MTPYYEEAGITIYHGDCRDILPGLLPQDIVTDPPYGIGFDYGTDFADDGESYREMIAPLRDCARIALLQYPEEMMSLVVPVLGPPDEVLAWVYPSNVRRQFRLWGMWRCSVDFSQIKQPARNPESTKVESLMVDSYDWWEQPQVKNVSAEKTAHPCQIPVTSVVRILKLTGFDYVVDPFMGSGTTLRAAKDLGRRAIGIEIEERYCEIAALRLAQGVLFGAHG